jgi:hypothetical protein
MNGVDYTRQLAKDREYFRDTIRKNNDAQEKRVADNNLRNENVQKKQLDSFVESKTDLEKSHEKTLAQVNEKNQKKLENKNEQYQRAVEKERDEFIKNSEIKRKEFDDRLSHIKDSYKKSFDFEKNRQDDNFERTKKNYDQNISKNRQEFDSKIKTHHQNAAKSEQEIRGNYKKEHRELTDKNDRNVKQLMKDSSDQRQELKTQIARDLQKTRDASQAQREQFENYTEEKIGTIKQNAQDRYRNLAQEYANKNDDSIRKQQQDTIVSNHENQKKLASVEREFNRELHEMELKKRREDSGNARFTQLMHEQKGNNEKIIHEKEVRNLRQKIADEKRTYQEQAVKDQVATNDTLKIENKRSTINMEKKINELNAERVDEMAKVKHENARKLDNLTYVGHQERVAYEKQLVQERQNAHERLEKLKQTFGKSMLEVEEKNKQLFEDITKVNQKDKTEFIKKMNEDRNKEISSMNQEFSRVMGSTVDDYEKRIADKQRENELLKMTMDQRIQGLIDTQEKEIESERKMVDQRAKAEIKALHVAQEQREGQHRTTLNQLNYSYQKKLDKMQVENDSKLKLITNDYENKLKELRNANNKTLADKELQLRMELDRFKQAGDAEKTALVSMYDNQISELKKSHETQVSQLKDYKRLS